MVIFTKFDAQIIQAMQLHNSEDEWVKAREKADNSFRSIYLARVLDTRHPPKTYVRLESEESKHRYLR